VQVADASRNQPRCLRNPIKNISLSEHCSLIGDYLLSKGDDKLFQILTHLFPFTARVGLQAAKEPLKVRCFLGAGSTLIRYPVRL